MGPIETEVVLNTPARLLTCFRLHRFGSLDPSFRLEDRRLLQSVQTTDGPGALEVEALEDSTPTGATRFRVRGYGPAGPGLVKRALRILGADDDPRAFIPACPTTRRLVRAVVGLRLVRAASPFALLVSLILQQRVAWRDAARAHALLVRRYGTRPPDAWRVSREAEAGAMRPNLLVPPEPKVWAEIPMSEFSQLGVDRRRAETVRQVAKIGGHVERLADAPPEEVERKLSSIPGLGPWTIASFRGFALGDPDALPLGDYDLPHRVALAFRGAARSNDHEMVEILEPYRGQRFRIVRLLEESGLRLVRFAPKRSPHRR